MKKNIRHKKKRLGKQTTLGKIWHFLWKSDSIWSWIIDLILIFLIVKFIIFPVFGLIFATPIPFVIIESNSMIHEGEFDDWFSLYGLWYLENNITKEQIEEWSWRNGLDKGDIIIVRGLKNYDYKIGEIIIFKVEGQKMPIIHRVIFSNETTFSTKGDHNNAQWPYEETIRQEQILGKAIGRIPKIGWIKLFFVGIFK